jgi:DtxR family transcriptional regulator, Mn-dependent transcriptional regulator
MSTEATQDYLKAIYALQESQETVATSALAARLGVTPPSVSAMLKRTGAGVSGVTSQSVRPNRGSP